MKATRFSLTSPHKSYFPDLFVAFWPLFFLVLKYIYIFEVLRAGEDTSSVSLWSWAEWKDDLWCRWCVLLLILLGSFSFLNSMTSLNHTHLRICSTSNPSLMNCCLKSFPQPVFIWLVVSGWMWCCTLSCVEFQSMASNAEIIWYNLVLRCTCIPSRLVCSCAADFNKHLEFLLSVTNSRMK